MIILKNIEQIIKKINYNGNEYNAVIGYYSLFMNYNTQYKHIISYIKGSSGDFYLEKDFITENMLKNDNIINYIPEKMFEL